MSQGVTYEQVAAILGCHFSNVAKLVRKGDLTSSGKRGASLSREQVEALAERRAAERAARAARPPRKCQRVDHRPDAHHEWLSMREVAALLGVTRPAVQGRIHRGTLPAAENGGRFWVWRDLLEQVEAARLVRKTRRLQGDSSYEATSGSLEVRTRVRLTLSVNRPGLRPPDPRRKLRVA